MRIGTVSAFIISLALPLFGNLSVATAATLVDFTDENAFDLGDLSEVYSLGGGSVTVTVSGNDTLTFQNFDGGPSCSVSLVCDHDGIGLGDDEISFGSQELTVSFSKTVSIVGYYFLDLFKDNNSQDVETAEVYRNGVLVNTFFADLFYQNDGGYSYENAAPLVADALVFKAGLANDGVGNADFALAGLEITAVPVPASLPLLAFGLGGLGLMARRKRKAA